MADRSAPTPAEATQVLKAARTNLGESLVAAYLHGSAVLGGLRPDSDVDVLVVVDRPITHEVRGRLLAELMEVSGHPGSADPRRPVELIAFHLDDLVETAYPRRCEFIYGEWLREAFEMGAVAAPETDPELTMVLAQARRTAKTLSGPDPTELLPTVSEGELRQAIGDALHGLLETLDRDERNVLLTLVRMWRTLETGEFVPKDAAAEWALPRLSGEAAALIDRARKAYLGTVDDDWRACRHHVRLVADDLRDRVVALL